MRLIVMLVAIVLVVACNNPVAVQPENCPVLVRADTLLGDTHNIVRYYQFKGDPIVYFVGPIAGVVPACR